jgi:hypothetical protein
MRRNGSCAIFVGGEGLVYGPLAESVHFIWHV